MLASGSLTGLRMYNKEWRLGIFYRGQSYVLLVNDQIGEEKDGERDSKKPDWGRSQSGLDT